MNSPRNLIGLAAFALAGASLGQISNEGWVPTGRPETYDGLLTGTVLGPARAVRLPHTGGPFATDSLAVQPVRVADSRLFRAGTVVDVYLRLQDQNQGPSPALQIGRLAAPLYGDALPVGKQVLILGAKATGTQLRQPWLYTDTAPAALYQLPQGAGPCLFGFAFFETTQPTLAPVADPMWRMLASVAGAIPGTDDENVRRVASFLDNVRLPEWKGDPTDRKADDRLSLLFSNAVAKESAYHRALIDYSLNKLYYVGYGDKYRQDAFASAAEPNSFPDGVPEPTYWEQPGSEGGLPKDFRHLPDPSPSSVILRLKLAQSPTVAAWLLQGAPKPSEADVRSLGRFLDSPDPRLRRAFVERLAAWNGEPGPEEPKDVRGPDGVLRREYPGLDALVARWKARLRQSAG